MDIASNRFGGITMYVAPQERPFQSLTLGSTLLGDPTQGLTGGLPSPLSALTQQGDGIARMLPTIASEAGAVGGVGSPFGAAGGALGGLQPILNALAQMLQQLTGMLTGSGGAATSGGTIPSGGEQQFDSATGSSVGDPHLSFGGTSETGATTGGHWDSMTGHSDLLESDSFSGGFQLSTTTTQPDSNGVTFNQQANVATNGGATNVSLDANGNATICNNGKEQTVANGQTIDLGNGETVARGADGSLQVTANDNSGGRITTTLRNSGPGVDVSVQANDVDLGGDLVNGSQNQPPPPMNYPDFTNTPNVQRPGQRRHVERDYYRSPEELSAINND
jgi:hypothetical protein